LGKAQGWKGPLARKHWTKAREKKKKIVEKRCGGGVKNWNTLLRGWGGKNKRENRRYGPKMFKRVGKRKRLIYIKRGGIWPI